MSNKKSSRRVGVKYFSLFILIFSLTTTLLADFSKSGDIVTDSKTGLAWQDNNDTNGTQRTWQEAIDYCEALDLGGHSDWRLPNVNELKTIIDRTKTQPAIVDGFEYVGSSNYGRYWSSSTFKGDEGNAWIVGFNNGFLDGYPKDFSRYVRCVRDGQ